MTIPEMIPKLEAWCAAMREMDKQYDALYALLGISPDWPLTRAILRETIRPEARLHGRFGENPGEAVAARICVVVPEIGITIRAVARVPGEAGELAGCPGHRPAPERTSPRWLTIAG